MAIRTAAFKRKSFNCYEFPKLYFDEPARVHTLPGTQCQVHPHKPTAIPARRLYKPFRATVGATQPRTHGDSSLRPARSRVRRGDNETAHRCAIRSTSPHVAGPDPWPLIGSL